MQLISIDEVPPVGFDWVADSRQISLAPANVFHHQTVNTCHLLPANWALRRNCEELCPRYILSNIVSNTWQTGTLYCSIGGDSISLSLVFMRLAIWQIPWVYLIIHISCCWFCLPCCPLFLHSPPHHSFTYSAPLQLEHSYLELKWK